MAEAPSSLVVTAQYSSGTHKAYLSWQNNASYTDINVRKREAGGDWENLGLIDGDRTSYTDSGISTNTLVEYKVRGWRASYGRPIVLAHWTGYSNVDGCTCWIDTQTDTLGLDDSGTSEYATLGTLVTETLSLDDSATSDTLAGTETVTETLSLGEVVKDSQSIRTDYGYFLGSSDGRLYEYSPDYKGDNSQSITSHWRSKTTDFSEQYPQHIDEFKTVYGAELKYVDKTADTPITLYYSTDGGVTWTSGGTNTVGNADGKTKRTKFYFIHTGEFFDFKIEHASADKEFQWIELQVDFIPAGEVKEIS